MKYRQMGRSGLTVSVVGLGGNNFGPRIDLGQTRQVVGAALDAGVTLFDTADRYGQSEELLGTALRDVRDRVVIATKFGMTTDGRVAPAHEARGGRRYLRLAVESSLRRLQTDWIDLLLLHEPDPKTPIDETLEALGEVIDAGKVRYIGSSNFRAWQIVEAELVAASVGAQRFVCAQNEYNLLERSIESEVLPVAERYGIGIVPFFPLANGLLTGKYVRGVPPAAGRLTEARKRPLLNDQAFDQIERVGEYAGARGLEMTDVAIGGLLGRPSVASVIAGATTPEQVRQNAAASEWSPSEADLEELFALTKPG